MPKLKPVHCLSLLIAACCSLPASGALIVTIGSYAAVAGHSVVVQMNVSNTADPAAADIEGMTFTLQIAGGAGATPSIQSIDLLGGTVWTGEASPSDIFTPAGGDLPQYQSRDLFTSSPGGFINTTAGRLATVTIDTTGASAGDYALKLAGTSTPGGDSAFITGLGDTLPATFNPGTLSISVPEPQPAILALIFLSAAFMPRRKVLRASA